MRGNGQWVNRIVAVVAVVAVGAGLECVAASADHRERSDGGPGAVPAVERVGLPAHYADLVDWALSLYDQAGLELPPLRIVHHGDDHQPCRGSTGFHHCRDGVSVIDLCTTTGGKLAERLVLHEIAHAWAAHGLTDRGMDEFQSLRGWTHWSAEDGVSWSDLGCEQAAEIIASGVSDRPIPTVLISETRCTDFEEGYRVLTGTTPPHGVPGRC